MTLLSELRQALPRGVRVTVYGLRVVLETRHADGLRVAVAGVEPTQDATIAACARAVRESVERWGPIEGTVEGEA